MTATKILTVTVILIAATMLSYWIWRRPSVDAVKDEDGFYRLRAIAWLRPEWFFLYFLLQTNRRLNEWIRLPPKVAIDRPFVEYDETFTIRIKLPALPRRPLNVKIGTASHRIESPEITNFIHTKIPLNTKKRRWNTGWLAVGGWYFRLPLIDVKSAKNDVSPIAPEIKITPHES